MDFEEPRFAAPNPCPRCRRNRGITNTCRGCDLGSPTPFPKFRCGTKPANPTKSEAAGLVIRAAPWYTFGDAVEAALRLEWWLDPTNKYHLRAREKRAWVEAVIPILYAGKRTIPHPLAFGVKPEWETDVFVRAREMGLPF